jgi:ATP-dependent RNA helicase DDX27
MAPKFEDDFIFTISDHDDVSDDGGADDIAAASAKLAGRGKKRKHTEDPDLNIRPKEVASKKAKKDKKGKKGKQAEAQPPAENDESDAEIAHPGEDVEGNDDIASDFEFAVGDIDTGFVEEFDGWGNAEGTVGREQNADKNSTAVDIDDIIERRQAKKKAQKEDMAEDGDDSDEGDFTGFGEDDELLAEDGFGMGAGSESDSEADDEEEAGDNEESNVANGSDDEDAASDDEDDVAPHVPHPMDLEGVDSEDEARSEEEDAVEAKKAADFFAPEESVSGKKKKGAKSTGSFHSMSLSRPIQRGLAAIGFTEPTPIQSKAIPIAMQGKDVASAVPPEEGTYYPRCHLHANT